MFGLLLLCTAAICFRQTGEIQSTSMTDAEQHSNIDTINLSPLVVYDAGDVAIVPPNNMSNQTNNL